MVSSSAREDDIQIRFLGYKITLGSLTVVPLVVGYALCSSLLAIINKAAVDVFPYPSALTALQYLTCVVVVLLLGKCKVLEHDPFTWDMIKKFLPAAFVFYMAIFTNTTLLKYANVDTFIVFRSSTPLLVAIADTLFRNQPWPSKYTFGSLLVILIGAIGYVVTDKAFTLRAYSWALAYLATITFEMVYIKHIVSSLGLNTWGFVLYNNFLSLLMAPVFWYLTGEYSGSVFSNVQELLQFDVLFPVLLSCVFGLAISFFGFACRKAISATAFTVVGVTNKLLTVVINVIIWSKHASAFGTFCLLITIVGGVIYQQSVVKAPPPLLPKALPPEEINEPAQGSSNSNSLTGAVTKSTSSKSKERLIPDKS